MKVHIDVDIGSSHGGNTPLRSGSSDIRGQGFHLLCKSGTGKIAPFAALCRILLCRGAIDRAQSGEP